MVSVVIILYIYVGVIFKVDLFVVEYVEDVVEGFYGVCIIVNM